MKLVQTPTLVVMLDEGNIHSYRQFFLDGRGHAKDLDPLWMGDSVAKWDGETLVVDTAGFNDKTWLDVRGHGHSEALRVQERFHRGNFGRMDIEATVDDPMTLTKPVTVKLLTDTFDWAIGVVGQLTAADLTKPFGNGKGPTMTGLELLYQAMIHTAHTRGYAEMYLRNKGVTPPEYSV